MPPEPTDVFVRALASPLPLWVIVVGLFVGLPAVALVGHRLGQKEYRRRVAADEDRGLPGETSLGALLALVGLLLGFTFSTVLGWREGRGAAVVEESAALGTAFLIADLVPDGGGRPLQEALFAYAQTRVVPDGYTGSHDEYQAIMVASVDKQAALWPATRAALGPDVPPPIRTAVAGSITEVLDAHTRRLAASAKSLPHPSSALLLFVTAAGVFMVGNRSALRGRHLTWRTFLFSIVLGSLLFVIEDLDRPTEGFQQIAQTPLEAAVADMETMLERAPPP